MPSDGTDYQSLPNALMTLMPTPTVQDGANAGGPSQFDRNSIPLNALVTLLPTPAVNDMGMAYTPDEWDAWTAKMKAEHNNGNGHGKSLNVEAQPPSLDVELLPTPSVADSTGGHERRGGERGEELLLKGVVRAVAEGTLFPTPRATDGTKGGPNQRGSSGDLMLPSAVNLLPTPRTRVDVPTSASARDKYSSGDSMGDVVAAGKWGEYEPAIRRWEAVTRPAPAPTKPGAKGSPKLSDEFDEWLMGYPAGWITDVPGVTWNEALKACGNGVVPQQGAAGVRYLLTLGGVA